MNTLLNEEKEISKQLKERVEISEKENNRISENVSNKDSIFK